MVKAIIFDRDGVLSKLVNGHAPWSLSDFTLYPDAKRALALTKRLNYKQFVITNQPDVMDRKLPLIDLQRMNEVLRRSLDIDGVRICLDRKSDRYKPKTGMVDELIDEWDIDVSKSFFVGDRWRDIVCGSRAGLTTILVRNAETQNDWPEEYNHIQPNFIVSDVLSACKLITEL
jgi:D-glycero-D-manno-heptose 1,7-bisphosphate phosphatase